MTDKDELSIRLRPMVSDDLDMFRRFATEPFLIGLDWAGFRDAEAPARRFATDGYLGTDDGRLMVEVAAERVEAERVATERVATERVAAERVAAERLEAERVATERVATEGVAAGFVSYTAGLYGGVAKHWEIGIALLPEWRGRGIGWRAQAMLCDYLFSHTPAQRIQAGTHPENIAEQRSLEKAGFQLEGVVRACEFRAGQWRDGYLYSRLRDDPSPL
jgi:RimJ/RimL family protein N-acetyltransferase